LVDPSSSSWWGIPDISSKLGALLVVLTGPRVFADALWRRSGVSGLDGGGTVKGSKIEEEKEEAAAAAAKSTYLVGFTPFALDYFKMSDCVVTQAGASTLNELAALGVPVVCLPIENHWEQNANADRFSRKYGFEILSFNGLSVDTLVECIRRAISNNRDSGSRSAGRQEWSAGPRRAAELILRGYF
jgi:UDP-N-acetylglucosamine:LPS N-acetylglucosamine transferase